MKKLMTGLFILVAFGNAGIAGVTTWFAIDFGWTPQIAVTIFMFFVCATTLMRAPFSKRNIDLLPVDILRIVLMIFLAAAGYWMAQCQFEENLDPLSIAITMLVAATCILLMTMKVIRRKFLLPG